MPSANNLAILAAAGSRKTEYIIDQALAMGTRRILITTYTNENQRHVVDRIRKKNKGVVPANISVLGWFSFLINECARPYQNMVTGEVGFMNSLNFVGAHHQRTRKTSLAYFFDQNQDIYRNAVSDFACMANMKSRGKMVQRLEGIYDHIFIDEVQDLAAYDLDLLDLLFMSDIAVTVVGDPRQNLFVTNTASRNPKFKKQGLTGWFEQRHEICTLEIRNESYRCNQAICDAADRLFPEMIATKSLNDRPTDHDGVFLIERNQVAEYVARYQPVILRENKNTDTEGFPAINIGVSKGNTFDRVLVFPTSTAIRYLKTGNLAEFKSKERLYVAMTRARFSSTFVE